MAISPFVVLLCQHRAHPSRMVDRLDKMPTTSPRRQVFQQRWPGDRRSSLAISCHTISRDSCPKPLVYHPKSPRRRLSQLAKSTPQKPPVEPSRGPVEPPKTPHRHRLISLKSSPSYRSGHGEKRQKSSIIIVRPEVASRVRIGSITCSCA